MPRKTIAGLEAEIEELEQRLADAVTVNERLLLQAQSMQAAPPNTYLSYLATGDAELDALQVVDRTIASLQDPLARDRLLGWLQARYLTDDGG